MSDSTNLVPVVINPFRIIITNEERESGTATADTLNRYLQYLNNSDTVKKASDRLLGLEILTSSILAIPANNQMISKLITPIKECINQYILGNHIVTIALSGYFAEMLAILLFEIYEVRINSNLLNTSLQEDLFGREFEKLGQERKIKILKVYGIIDQNTYDIFENIKNIRNRYLHYWSVKNQNIEKDSFTTIDNVFSLLHFIFPQQIRNGKLIVNNKLYNYLKKTDN